MADDRQQVKVERTRRSQRTNGQEQEAAPTNGQAYQEAQGNLGAIDAIIQDMVAPAAAQASVVLGSGQPQDTYTLSSEELVRNFRQQSGQ
jgi:phage protein U